MKLISSTEFILEQSEKYLKGFIALNEYHSITLNYANFLKQTLTLGMFVPVDEEGNFLEEPEPNDLNGSFFKMQTGFHKEKQYEEAKSKVLFEGFTSPDNFKVNKGNDYDYYIIKFPIEHYGCSYNEYDNINGTVININSNVEGVIGVTLTETAIKMIYGD